MARRIAIEDAYESIEVELWGHVFETVETTKKLRKRLDKFQEQWEEAAEDTEILDAVCATIDLRLKPTDGKRVKPSTLLRRRYDGDQISVARILRIVGEIGRADLLPS